MCGAWVWVCVGVRAWARVCVCRQPTVFVCVRARVGVQLVSAALCVVSTQCLSSSVSISHSVSLLHSFSVSRLLSIYHPVPTSLLSISVCSSSYLIALFSLSSISLRLSVSPARRLSYLRMCLLDCVVAPSVMSRRRSGSIPFFLRRSVWPQRGGASPARDELFYRNFDPRVGSPAV